MEEKFSSHLAKVQQNLQLSSVLDKLSLFNSDCCMFLQMTDCFMLFSLPKYCINPTQFTAKAPC